MDPFIIMGLDGVGGDLRAMLQAQPLPGVWGEKIGDDLIRRGAETQLETGFPNKFVDLKHHDTKDRLKRMVAMYASFPHPPALLTVNGDYDDLELYREIVGAAHPKGPRIILTGPLSSWDDDFCRRRYLRPASAQMTEVMALAVKSGAEGVTCPARLLKNPDVQRMLTYYRKKHYLAVVATGIRSEGLPPGNHVDPQTPAWAMQNGATHVVVESEVTGLPGREPIEQIQKIYDSVVAKAPA